VNGRAQWVINAVVNVGRKKDWEKIPHVSKNQKIRNFAKGKRRVREGGQKGYYKSTQKIWK